MTLTVPTEAFDKKVLDPVAHLRLVKNIEQYAERAGVAPHHLWTSALDVLEPGEVEYLRRCRIIAKHGNTSGLLYIKQPDVVERFSIMAGALVRAFVDARVQTSAQVVDQIRNGDEPEATVLFIPNFFSTAEYGKFDSNKAAALGDLLCRRASRCEQTVVHVDSLNDAGERFSSQVIDLLKTRFTGDKDFKQGELGV